MKNQTFTHFSYNSPVKPQNLDEVLPQIQDGIKNVPIKSEQNANNKKGESLTDSNVLHHHRMDEHQKNQRGSNNLQHNSVYQDEDSQSNPKLRHTNNSETALVQPQNQQFVKNQTGTATESPFQNRSKKASHQNVNVSCLPNIFQDQDEYNFMRQQQQAILSGLMIDGKQSTNASAKRNQESAKNSAQASAKKKNQGRVRSSQHHQESQSYLNGNEDYVINNKYQQAQKTDRPTKSTDQRYTSSLKKAIKVSLNRNPALAASLEIYSNGNQHSMQQMAKVVQPYLVNQFIQKRKNLLQKKININHLTAAKRNQHHSLQQRNYANSNIINGNKNNNSFNIFHNKSQIIEDSGQQNGGQNNSQLQKIMIVSNNNANQITNQTKQNNIQTNNIVINKSANSKPANLNSLLSEYRTNSGGQRLLLQDFYSQQGIKDPEIVQKQQSLYEQNNYSKQNVIDKSASGVSKNNNSNAVQSSNSQGTGSQSTKEITRGSEKKLGTLDQDLHEQQQQLHQGEESVMNVSDIQTVSQNAYDVYQENNNDFNDQSYSSNVTQSFNPKQINISNSRISLQKKNTNYYNDNNEHPKMNRNYDFEYQGEDNNSQERGNQRVSVNSNTIGEHINIVNTNNSPRSKRYQTNSQISSPVIDLTNFPTNSQNTKSPDETLSPLKNSKTEKSPQQPIIHQRIMYNQQKRRGNSFNHTKGGTFSIGANADPSFDLSIVNGVPNNNQNNNTISNTTNIVNTKQFDFYENKSIYQQNMFSPPRIHKSRAVYVHSNTMNQMNQAEANKFIGRLDTNTEEDIPFLNEEKSDKRSQSNPRPFLSSVQNDQILLIKSHLPEQQQQQQQQVNLELKANVITATHQTPQKQTEGAYTCYFLRGNNSGLVRRVLLTRSNWKESPVYSSNLNFRWHPFSKGIKFESLSIHKKRIVNHFEFHAEITTKNGIIKNIGRYCNERGLNIFDFTPSTFLFSLKDKFWDLDLIRFCDFFYKNLPEPLKGQNEYKKNVFEIKSKFRQIQIKSTPVVNNNAKNPKKKQPVPSLMPGVDKYGEMKIHSTFLGDDNNSYMWLLKPTNLNRGRGIELFSNLFQLETLLNNYFDGFYEQPITDKVQCQDEKLTKEEHQNMLLDIAMAESTAANNKQISFEIASNEAQKEREEPILKTLLNKSLYQTPDIVDKSEEKGKPVESMKANSNSNKDNNTSNTPKNNFNKENKPKDIQSLNINSPTSTVNLCLDQTEGDKFTLIGDDALSKEQESPKKSDDNDNELKPKKQKIKKNRTSNSNHNVNYNNNIHIARVRELSLPKKPFVLTNNNNTKSPNSPDKKGGKNSNGISAEFGGYLMKEHSFVIQKYIEKPFLINDRKFDIRMWVLVNQNMDVYLFKEGYIRTSSKKYDISDQENIFIHLTNNAIQKYSDTYGQFENGNQLSLDNFDEYLKVMGYKQTFRGDIMPRIKEIITISLLSVKNKLNANDRKFSFELFGYDFFIDQQFNVWLIEINTNPCIEESSPLLEMLIPRMIDDALKLSVDLIFPPQYSDEVIQKQLQKHNLNKERKQQSEGSPKVGNEPTPINQFYQKKCLIESLFPVKNYSSQENMFSFLVNLYKSN